MINKDSLIRYMADEMHFEVWSMLGTHKIIFIYKSHSVAFYIDSSLWILNAELQSMYMYLCCAWNCLPCESSVMNKHILFVSFRHAFMKFSTCIYLLYFQNIRIAENWCCVYHSLLGWKVLKVEDLPDIAEGIHFEPLFSDLRPSMWQDDLHFCYSSFSWTRFDHMNAFRSILKEFWENQRLMHLLRNWNHTR